MFLKIKHSNKPLLLYLEKSSTVYFLLFPVKLMLLVFLCEQNKIIFFPTIFLKVAPLQRDQSFLRRDVFNLDACSAKEVGNF